MIFLLVRKKRCPQAFFLPSCHLLPFFFVIAYHLANEGFCRLSVLVGSVKWFSSFRFFFVSFLYVKGWIINFFASTAAAGFHSSKLMVAVLFFPVPNAASFIQKVCFLFESS